jgi:hypothetical protein
MPRKLNQLLVFATLIFSLFLLRRISRRDSAEAEAGSKWSDVDVVDSDISGLKGLDEESMGSGETPLDLHFNADIFLEPKPEKGWGHTNFVFQPGNVKPVGSTYTKMLVLPRTTEEDVSWVKSHFPPGSGISAAIYVVDDIKAELHPPKNKGNEVMVYLTYIIDHYNDLADVNIFMHSHQYAWHNNDLMENDAVQMIGRLSAERVQRQGYMNLRCQWEPGCPAWLHPTAKEPDINKQEEAMLAKSWSELFPLNPVPKVLSQPCCAQFAVSKDRIRALPKARYVFYRDWLLRTPLSDYITGRIWEYIWQYVFTGQNIACPREHICYCDGFGICFGGEEQYKIFWEKMMDKRHFEDKLREWHELNTEVQLAIEEGRAKDVGKMRIPTPDGDVELSSKIRELEAWLNAEKENAKKRGDVAMNRAKEVGRPWKQGDGF